MKRASLIARARETLSPRYLDNFSKIFQSNFLALLISVAVYPLLTRLFSPEDFGQQSLFLSILALAAPVLTMRAEWLIPNPRRHKQVAILCGVGLALVAFWTLFAVLVAATGLYRLLPGEAGAAPLVYWVLPLGLAVSGAGQVLNGWHVRSAELRQVGRARIAQALSTTGVSTLGGFAGVGAIGLLAAVTLGNLVNFVAMFRRQWWATVRMAGLTRRMTAATVRRYWRQSLWSTMTSLVNAVSLTLITFLIVGHFPLAEAGWYALAQRVIGTPMQTVTSALSSSFWAEAAKLVHRDPERLRKLYLTSTAGLSLLAVPILAVCLSAPFYVGPIFGAEKWGGAGAVLAAMAPRLAIGCIVSPLSHLVVHERQGWQLVWDLARAVSLCSVFLLCINSGLDIVQTIFVASCLEGAFYGVLFGMNLFALRHAVAVSTSKKCGGEVDS